MTFPPEMWIALNTFGLVLLGLLAAWNTYRATKIEAKVSEVKTIVDGPLSVALKSNADLARKLADTTQHPDDIKAADEAAAVNQNRMAGKEQTALA